MGMHNPTHPGELVREVMGDTDVTEFAGKLGVSRVTLSRLLNGKGGHLCADGAEPRRGFEEFRGDVDGDAVTVRSVAGSPG